MTTPRTTTFTFALLNSLFMVAGMGIAAWSLYPVYGSPRFVSVAAAGILAGAAVTVVCERLGWGAWIGAGLGLLLFLAIGMTLAIPGVASGATPVAVGLGELLRGPVTGWKDIVTLPLPLGEFGATLVPLLALLLVGTLVATWVAVRARRWWGFAAVVLVGVVVTAVVVGPATRAEPFTFAPYGVYMTREFVVGITVFTLLLWWFGWRAAYSRRRAISHASNGARLTSTPHMRTASAMVLAATMIVVGVSTAAIFAGPVAADTPRDVARTVIDPRLVINSSVTPLAGYRTYFSDPAYDADLFSVRVTSGDVARVRLAVLPYFTGDEFTAAAPADAIPSRFEHVPSAIVAPSDSTPVTAEVSIHAASGYWTPLVGSLGSVVFDGADAGALLDSFFYQPDTTAGLVTIDSGLRAGDSYTVHAYVPTHMPSLADIGAAPGGDVIDTSLIPSSLSDWVTRQGVTRDGAGLAELVQTLRERGYLSHDLSEPSAIPLWQAALGPYAFVSSAAGHSYDRIDRMFIDLSARESEVGDTPGANLVAAVGDDEQFAVAVALIAADLGFPSRVVLGARLTDTDPDGWTVPACADGVCKGKNMAVWTEVQSSNGTWVPIDVTPQHSLAPSPDVTRQQDPKFASDLDPQRAEPIVPPTSQRGGASQTDPPATQEQGVWGWLAPVLTAAGISLLAVLVLLGPFIAILVWKALRRRRRRRAEPRDAIHHGWDEYLDTAVDAGLPALPLATRLEAARAYGSPNAERIARLTDAATFGTGTAVEDDAEQFWSLVAADRRQWLSTRGFWARLRMRLSLRSMFNAVALQAPQTIPSSTTTVVDPQTEKSE